MVQRSRSLVRLSLACWKGRSGKLLNWNSSFTWRFDSHHFVHDHPMVCVYLCVWIMDLSLAIQVRPSPLFSSHGPYKILWTFVLGSHLPSLPTTQPDVFPWNNGTVESRSHHGKGRNVTGSIGPIRKGWNG